MASSHSVDERLSYDGALCTVRYIGPVAGTTGTWLGVEWDDPTRGRHDGQHKGVRYFECWVKSPTSASFIRPTRPHDAKTDFLTALHEKYATHHVSETPQIVFGVKVAEEVGFDKIGRQQAQLDQLKIVILDGMRLDSAYSPAAAKRDRSIRDVCPSVVELGLSRNLFTKFGPVVDICAELDELKVLKLNSNRFTKLDDGTIDIEKAVTAFKGVREVALDETLLSWHQIMTITSNFPDLTTLSASTNQLLALSPIPSTSPLTTTLTSLNLEFNAFTSLSDISPLSQLTSLRNLHLKHNHIATILSPTQPPTTPPPIFSPTITYLDLSSNLISSWSFADALPHIFPGLASLRIAHNPIYDNPDLDTPVSSTSSKPTELGTSSGKNTEESYMLLAARLPMLKTINFSTVTPQDRTNADMFYLSRIARQMAAVPEAEETAVTARHPRYASLCETYGPPVVSRQKEIDARFLEGRVVSVRFTPSTDRSTSKVLRIPKSFDLYAVKGIAARLFGISPVKLRLVWETGEWDPVGGFDDETGDSSEDEEVELRKESGGESDAGRFDSGGEKTPGGGKSGRFVRREVELADGPRQFGYCVDGAEAMIRVEVC